jgi:hypothetical protein
VTTCTCLIANLRSLILPIPRLLTYSFVRSFIDMGLYKPWIGHRDSESISLGLGSSHVRQSFATSSMDTRSVYISKITDWHHEWLLTFTVPSLMSSPSRVVLELETRRLSLRTPSAHIKLPSPSHFLVIWIRFFLLTVLLSLYVLCL